MKVQSISGRKVYKFRMEPTELEALELKRTASVARYIYNWGLACCQEDYRLHGKGKPWGGAIGRAHPAQADCAVAV